MHVAQRSSAYEVEVEPSGIRWVKSSASDGSGSSCVELAAVDGMVHLRDSKDRAGARLIFPWTSFTRFASDAGAGWLGRTR